jgi:hypothetical protein
VAALPASCLAAAGGTVAALPLAWRVGRAPCSAGACRRWAAVLGCSLGGLAVAAGGGAWCAAAGSGG